jgi:hypothetical protein
VNYINDVQSKIGLYDYYFTVTCKQKNNKNALLLALAPACPVVKQQYNASPDRNPHHHLFHYCDLPLCGIIKMSKLICSLPIASVRQTILRRHQVTRRHLSLAAVATMSSNLINWKYDNSKNNFSAFRSLTINTLKRPPSPSRPPTWVIGQRYFSTNNNNNTADTNQIKEDRAIFAKEQSILHSLSNLFSSKPKFHPPPDVMIFPTVPIRMKHGLIQKYQFDLLEFITGVKQAYPTIRQAFADKEKALTEGKSTAMAVEADDLLNHVLHPYFHALYTSGLGLVGEHTSGSCSSNSNAGNAMIKIVIGDKTSALSKTNNKPKIETTQLQHTTIGDLDIHMVDEEYYQIERTEFNKLIIGMTKLIDVSDRLSDSEKQQRKEKLANLEIGRLYPEGSVVLSVEAFFLFEDYFTVDQEIDGQLKHQKFKRLVGERAFFRSCISGQVPMDWRLTMTEVVHNVTVKAD